MGVLGQGGGGGAPGLCAFVPLATPKLPTYLFDGVDLITGRIYGMNFVTWSFMSLARGFAAVPGVEP